MHSSSFLGPVPHFYKVAQTHRDPCPLEEVCYTSHATPFPDDPYVHQLLVLELDAQYLYEKASDQGSHGSSAYKSLLPRITTSNYNSFLPCFASRKGLL